MHDYGNYGAFKQSRASESWAKGIARRLGIRNRYVRFLDGVPRDGAVLEIGCGDGSFIRELRRRGFQDVRGVELSSSYVGLEDIHIGDAGAFLATLPEGSLDAIVALDVFEHIPVGDLRNLLILAKSRIRQSGRIIARVPNMGSPLALLNQYGDISHMTALNEVSIHQIAFDADLAVEAIHAEPLSYPGSVRTLLGYILWPAYRLVTRSVLATFGVRQRILTPNLIAVLRTR